MVTKTDAFPDVAIPPGEYLAEEIEARGISQTELARRMGRAFVVAHDCRIVFQYLSEKEVLLIDIGKHGEVY